LFDRHGRYTLGAIQNTCTEIEYVEMMQEYGAVARLQELVRTQDPQLEQYAKGALLPPRSRKQLLLRGCGLIVTRLASGG
jgi:hypothetical protein